MKRRAFIQTTTIAASGMALSGNLFADAIGIQKIGVQLFSLPKMLEKDFRAGIKMLSGMGYKELELYGPYPFSTQAARDRWSSVTPALGFSGSGFFGLSASEVKGVLKENGLTTPSIHTDLDTLKNNMDQLGEAGKLLGYEYVVLPAIPNELRKNLDDYKRIADDFNKIGASAKKAGLKFTYHNHGYGLQETEGKVPLNVILDGTDPKLVYLEMDLYWTVAGGADPVKYLEKYPGRYHLMHVKDMKEKKRFSGDGGDSQQWIELFPFMTTAGSGVIDLKTILAKAKQKGVKHFYVEQDMVANPEVALKKSFDYLKSL